MGKTFSGKNKDIGYKKRKDLVEKGKREDQKNKGRKSNKNIREEIPTIDPNGIEKFNKIMESKKVYQEDDEKEL